MKYSFILLSEESEGFLEKIQELGVVDVTRSARPVDERSAAMLDEVLAANKITGKIEGLDFSKEGDFDRIREAAAGVTLEENLTAGAQKALVRLEELILARNTAEKETAARKPWGDFDRSRLDNLDTLGYTVRYYRVPAKKFSKEWAKLYPLEIINEDKSYVWFVTVSRKDEE